MSLQLLTGAVFVFFLIQAPIPAAALVSSTVPKTSSLVPGQQPTAAGAPPPAAQLRGSVLDENGLLVAGVEASVRSPQGQAQTTYTDEAGHFQIRSLRPGENRVTLSKTGFFRLADYPVELNEGPNEVAFTLHHESEVHETIEVASSENRVEPKETAHQETLLAHEIRDIPVASGHDFKRSLPAIPSVVRDNSGQLHVAGARPGETEFELDGFEIGDPATGQMTSRVNVDSVRAVEVQSGRYGVQYAHAGAGVLAVDTTTGDDRWRFGITNFFPGISFERGVHFGNWFPRVVFSGPLRKGRMWFSDGISLQHSFKLISGQASGADTITEWAGDNLFRMQINLTPGQVLQVGFLYNQLTDSNVGLNPFTLLSTTTDLQSRRSFVFVKDQISFRNTLLELGAALDTGRSASSPQGSQAYVVSPSGTSGNFFETLRQRGRRSQFIGRVALPSRRWHGSHDLSTGVNVDEVAFAHQAMRNVIEVDRADGTLSQRATFFGAPQYRLTNTQIGSYAQDSWQIFRPLLVRVGLRADWDRIVHRTVVQPRVAANILPFHTDRAKLALAWGAYYQPIDLSLWGQAFDQQRMDVFFDATGSVPVRGPVVTQFGLPPVRLKQPRFHTTSVEWVEKIGENTLASIHFAYRNEYHGLVYELLESSDTRALFLLENSRRDRYRSVGISVRHSFGQKAELFADYTRSRARSNQVLDPSVGAPVFAPPTSGVLPWDAPNRLISWGSAPTPIWKLFLSYFFEYRSGFPVGVVNSQQQPFGPLNLVRFPNYINLNVGIEKRFRFHKHEWAARVSAINIIGRRNPDSVVGDVNTPNSLKFAGGQGRAFTGRLRLVEKK